MIRMIRAGVRRKDGRFATGVLHLWHPEADRSRLAANQTRLDELIKSDRVRALSGLSALTHRAGRGGGMMLRNLYSRKFFAHLREGSAGSARALVPIVLDIHPARSMIDVGCGIGGWVKAFAEHGVNAVGIDGDYVDRKQLLIPEDRFIAHDLNRALDVADLCRRYGDKQTGRFDLAISLEVAEHLRAAALRQPGARPVRACRRGAVRRRDPVPGRGRAHQRALAVLVGAEILRERL